MENVAIIGGGESGVGAAILAKKKGLVPFVTDSGRIQEKYKKVLLNHEIEWEESKHDVGKLKSADLVVKSPGVPDEVPLIRELLDLGIPIISEIEFAYRFCNSKLIAVTGSNGKTTVSMMIYHILQKGGLDVAIAGNVGDSFAGLIADSNPEFIVLEVSSFQLDNIQTFRADIAIVLNITVDHLDRYENDLQKYADAKLKIVENSRPTDYFIYNEDDDLVKSTMSSKSYQAQTLPISIKKQLPMGAYINNEQLIININNNQFNMSIHELALQGKHNLYNSMASGIASRILDLRKEIIRESLSDFQNVEHRLEHVATIHGIEFINDSKATNVNSTWYALESLTKPTVWIVGGVDKGNDYSELTEIIQDKVKAIICLGKDNQKIKAAFKESIQIIEEASSATEAVKKAYEIGQKGDVVLLSPACASFDLFENYEDRGHQFKRAVRAL